jgi:two-component system chemotaxis sensor kinase CheA
VLVIDDSLTTRMLERSILESAGYEVDVASSGEQALDMAERRPYDLFIVDVEMPGMSGFDFVARTRQSVDLRGVPSIVVTSRDTESDRRRGLAAGARAYVVKSRFAADELLSLVASLVG